MKPNFEVVIVGAGVAGMTAAIYLKRANINCCILEKDAPGGQMNKTSIVENYPGLSKITGPELSMKMYEQIQQLEVPYRYGKVIEIRNQDDLKMIKTETEEISCKGVILAVGRTPRKLGLPLEEQLSGAGLSWCAICDGPLYKDKKVAVVGGGNSALEEALYLAKLCKQVTIIHRKDYFTAQAYLIEKVKKQKKIKILFSSEVESYLEKENRLDGLVVIDRKKNKTKKVKVEGCFLYVGHVPNTESFKNLGILNEMGYIVTDANRKTKLPFVYGAGDAISKELYQIVTASSDGALAATSYIRDSEIH